MTRILRASGHKSMPWKNGGGTTTEIAVHPEGAGLGDFDWRVSIARIESDGPFSVFPGIDRTLVVLDGKGVTLKVEGRIPLGLLATSVPVTFPADVATSCNLFKEAITDLNVMVRRGSFAADVHRITLDDAADFASDAGTVLMFCNRGDAGISAGPSRFRLSARDCLLSDRREQTFRVRPRPACELIVVELRSIADRA